MSDSNFTQKEILLQVMSELRELRLEMSDQRVLLQTHIQASGERDHKIAEIKKEIDEIKKDIEDVKGFKIKVLTVWAIGIAIASFLANRVI
jgi:cob(I)alamin adenosyltransferase